MEINSLSTFSHSVKQPLESLHQVALYWVTLRKTFGIVDGDANEFGENILFIKNWRHKYQQLETFYMQKKYTYEPLHSQTSVITLGPRLQEAQPYDAQESYLKDWTISKGGFTLGFKIKETPKLNDLNIQE